ncbi:hypothetical protein NVP1123O_49 [Vibrio phage 1.123.O._10N.286.48.F3]|nr:hypothetical protein NVP1123O_49 [Vibrio phage 1.123.O._10N.286.48.F3]
MDIKKVLRITELAVQVSRETEHDVFASYSGHVDSIEVHYHKGGWSTSSQPIFMSDIFGFDLFGKPSDSELDKIISYLEGLL